MGSRKGLAITWDTVHFCDLKPGEFFVWRGEHEATPETFLKQHRFGSFATLAMIHNVTGKHLPLALRSARVFRLRFTKAMIHDGGNHDER